MIFLRKIPEAFRPTSTLSQHSYMNFSCKKYTCTATPSQEQTQYYHYTYIRQPDFHLHLQYLISTLIVPRSIPTLNPIRAKTQASKKARMQIVYVYKESRKSRKKRSMEHPAHMTRSERMRRPRGDIAEQTLIDRKTVPCMTDMR